MLGRAARTGFWVLICLRCCWVAAQDEDSSSFYLDALRDRAVDGTLRSVVAQISSSGDPQPEVQLSSFLHLGCLQIANLSDFGCEVTSKSSRLDCLSWCEEQQVDARLPQSVFVQGSECSCCNDPELLDSVQVASTCDLLCEDQENDIYGAPAFASAARRSASCGGVDTYSAFRQWDGMSPLGRRGAFAVPYGVWYEVVAAHLPDVLTRNVSTFANSSNEWQTYANMSYFLHAVHVETGWPVFAHQMLLGFLPECLHYDAFRQQVIALARTTGGGVHVTVLCPSCSDGVRMVKVLEALSDAEAQLYEMASPACTFDPEKRHVALVVVPLNDTSGEKSQMLEVDLLKDVVTWKASQHFDHVLAMETCRPMPETTDETVEPYSFTTLLADGSESSEGDFLLASPDALVQLDGKADLTRCGSTPCAGSGPKEQELVYLMGSASHPTHSFVFFAVEPGPGENFSSEVDTIDTRIAQSRCDGGSSGAFLWSPVTGGERVALEAPFDRTEPNGLVLPAPRLVLAEFLSSGRQVMLSFDRPTLMGAVPRDTDGDGLADTHNEADAWRRNFPCSWVVGVKSLQQLLLSDATCTWMTEQELVIDLPVDGPAEVGSAFFLRSGVIFGYSAAGTYSPPSSGAVYLVPPQSEASAPVPVVAGPRLVDYCTTLELDASASRNTAGQPNVSWHLHGVQCYAFEGEEPEGYCNTTLMELAMEDTTSALLQIEAAERPPELQFVLIEAVVTNRWGVSASLVVQVNISQVPKPSLDITTSPPSPNPFRGLALRASIKQSGCVQTPLNLAWQLLSVTATAAASSASSAEALEGRAMEMWRSSSGGSQLGIGWNSSNLLFPPLSLAAGVIYHFQLSIDPVLIVPGYASTQEVFVQVDPSPLQMTFRQPLLVIRKDQEVDVDMSPSFDPDNPEAILPAPSWSCKALDPEDACPTALTQALGGEVPFCYETSASSSVACRVRSSVLRVKSNVFNANVKVQLMAQVEADVVSDSDPWWRSPSLLSRVGTAAAEVVVQDQDDTLTALQPITVWIVSLSQFRLNEHEPLRLEGFAIDEANGQGTSDGYGNLQYHWAIERLNSNPAWEAARASLEGSSYQVPEEIYSPVPSTQAQLDSVTSSSLRLPEKALFPGAQYRFVFNVSDINNPSRFSIAATEIKVTQSQPHLGSLRVSPTRGVSGVTEFTLEAYGWSAEEDGMPLLYDFGYLDAQGPQLEAGAAEIRLGSGPAALLITSNVPAGDITFFVDVYTTWGGSLRASVAVTVDPYPILNATLQRLADALRQIEVTDPARALAQLPVLLTQFPEGGNVSNSVLMSAFMSTWMKARDGLLASSVSGLPSWPPPGLDLTVSTLMESLRPLCWRFLGAEAQLECTKGMRPLVAASFPSAAVIDQLRLMPERVPEPILQPERRLASSLIRSLTDVAFMDTSQVPVVRRLQATNATDSNESSVETASETTSEGDSTDSNALASSNEAMEWILTSLAQSHYSLIPHLTPGESYQITSPTLTFFSTRMERGSTVENYTDTRPFALEVESNFMNPSSWLYASFSLPDTLGYPVGAKASDNLTAVEESKDLPFLAFLAVGDSVGIPRQAKAEFFGPKYMALATEPPAATCYRWQAESSWIRQGVLMEESGACVLNLTTGGDGIGSMVLVGMFYDDEQAYWELLAEEEAKLTPEEETGQPPVLAAFGGLAALLLLNVGLAALSRLADIHVKDNKSKGAPRNYMESPGYKLARIIPDFLVYGTDVEESGVHLVRSWLSACLASHLFVGLYTSDSKVPLIQKVVILITTCVSATGCASLLLARLGYPATVSAILGGLVAWPCGLLVKALYEWRPWSPAHIDMNEALDASEQVRIKELLSDEKDPSSVRTDPSKSAYEAHSDDGVAHAEGAESPKSNGSKVVLRKASSEAVADAAAAGSAAGEAKVVPTIVLSETPGMKGLKLGTGSGTGAMNFLQIPASSPPKLQALKLGTPQAQRTAGVEDKSKMNGEGTPTQLHAGGLVFGSLSTALEEPLWREGWSSRQPFWKHWWESPEEAASNSRSRRSPWASPRTRSSPSAGRAQAVQVKSGAAHREVARLAVAGDLLASAVAGDQVKGIGACSPVAFELQVSSRPLPKPKRSTVARASKEVEKLLTSFRQEPPPIAQQLWSQLPLEEQSLKHMMKQLHRTEAAHVRRLERSYVEEAQQDLPNEVSMVMLLLAYLGAMGVFTAGAGCTMNYWNWISSSAVGDYLGAIIGSMAVVSALEMLRMVLVLCVAMARLETRRRASQAKWTRKHPEVLEVKPNIPLGTSSGTTASTRRWPGVPALPQPPKVGSKTKVNPAASSASLASKADKETGGFWALPRMLRKLRRGDTRVAPERDAEQKAAKKWKFLRKVNPEEAGGFGIVPSQGALSADEVKRRVEEREAEQVAAMMNMVPPWQEASSRYQPAGAATVRRAEQAWTAAKTNNTKKTKSSRVRFDMPEDLRPILPSSSAAPTTRRQ